MGKADSASSPQADIGLIGLAVMGENLILNMESKGFTVACFNRTVSKVDEFINGRGKNKNLIGCHSIEELAGALNKPRKVMLMIKAGQAVDDFIELVLPLLKTETLSLTAATVIFLILFAGQLMLRVRVNFILGLVFPAAKRALFLARRLCRVAHPRHGPR